MWGRSVRRCVSVAACALILTGQTSLFHLLVTVTFVIDAFIILIVDVATLNIVVIVTGAFFARADSQNVVNIFVSLLLALAVHKQMLVADAEAVSDIPVLDEHVFKNVKVSSHQLTLAIACTPKLANIFYISTDINDIPVFLIR